MNILKNIETIRDDFPILNTSVNGNKLIYLDNAATSQTPNCVINSISDYYKNLNSNIKIKQFNKLIIFKNQLNQIS